VEGSLEGLSERLVRRHSQLRDALAGSGVKGADVARLSKEYRELTLVVQIIWQLRRAREELSSLAHVAESGEDEEVQQLAAEELRRLRERLPNLEQQMRLALLTKDNDDQRNAILELRAGTGGEEAALFAAELFRMYQRYAALRAWRFEILDVSETGLGGFKEASGRDVFARLSSSPVCTAPSSGSRRPRREAESIPPRLLSLCCPRPRKSMCGSKKRSYASMSFVPAGQAVSQSIQDSAARITQIPTRLVVIQQDKKSQHKNRAKALKALRWRFYDIERRVRDNARATKRQRQVDGGDRSERIRTYNFP
jgi:peptide chain release factor 1